MAKELTVSSSWKFSNTKDLTKFIKKFNEVKGYFFKYNDLETGIEIIDGETYYYACLINKRPQIKGVGNIDGNEDKPGSYDSVSFMKQAESNQSPSKTSYMTRMKKTKLEKK